MTRSDGTSKMLRRAATGALVLALAMSASAAQAQDEVLPSDRELPLGPFSLSDEDPVSSVPTPEQAAKNPLEMGYFVMTASERAEAAEQRKDYKKAAQYYLAIAKAGSDVAIGFSRACKALAAAGDHAGALAACRTALGRQGATGEDYLRFVSLMLRKEARLSPEELVEIDAALQHLEENAAQNERDAHAVSSLKCQLAVRLEDEVRLTRCVESVKGYAPEDVEAFVFRSLHAIKQERWDDAEKLMADAERAEIPADLIKRTRESVEARRAYAEESKVRLIDPGSWWIVGAASLLTAALGMVVSRRRPLKPDAA